jgi:hypothetical protein
MHLRMRTLAFTPSSLSLLSAGARATSAAAPEPVVMRWNDAASRPRFPA